MTKWKQDEYGNLTFKHGDWTLVIRPSSPNEIEASNVDGDLELEVNEDDIVVRGEARHSWSTSPESVRIPFAILRAILDVCGKEGQK